MHSKNVDCMIFYAYEHFDPTTDYVSGLGACIVKDRLQPQGR